MVDSHTHTFFSKHAVGTINELVEHAIKKGVKILTITDHAPFYFDELNRLHMHELEAYYTNIENARSTYKKDIKILIGLECDYILGAYQYTYNLINQFQFDFLLGAIHYIHIPATNEVIRVWDLNRISEHSVITQYCNILKELIESKLFNSVAHLDSLLRAIPETQFLSYVEPLLKMFKENNLAYELNTSGLRKTTLESTSCEEVVGKWSYPSKLLLQKLLSYQIPLTIGSDSHTPEDVGCGIDTILQFAYFSGATQISYFERQKEKKLKIKNLLTQSKG